MVASDLGVDLAALADGAGTGDDAAPSWLLPAAAAGALLLVVGALARRRR